MEAASSFDFGVSAWDSFNEDVKRAIVDVLTMSVSIEVNSSPASSPLSVLQLFSRMGATWSSLPTRPRNRLILFPFFASPSPQCHLEIFLTNSFSLSFFVKNFCRLALALAKLCDEARLFDSASPSSYASQVLLGLEELQGKWRMFPIELRNALTNSKPRSTL